MHNLLFTIKKKGVCSLKHAPHYSAMYCVRLRLVGHNVQDNTILNTLKYQT